MEDIIKYNFDTLNESIAMVKEDYPNIDDDPDSHDGSYELVQEIIKQYKKEIDNSSKWDKKDVDALYFATTFVLNDTKIKKIYESNLINKENLKQISQRIHSNFLNDKYTNNIDKSKDFGMFNNVKGSCDKTSEYSQSFIKFCTEIIDENDKNVIYGKFGNLCNILSDNNASIGILSQILHCLKPKVFPILNGAGLIFFQKALDIKMQSENGGEIQISNKVKDYIKVIKSIQEVTDKFEFKNYRIPDIVAQNYYIDFDNINKYFKECAGTPSENRTETKKCRDGHKNFKSITSKINNGNFICYVHNWQQDIIASSRLWAEYTSDKFKGLPYSISLFAENNEDGDMFFRMNIECKGDEDTTFMAWTPESLSGFKDSISNKSKLVKVFNGPFEYANSKYIMEQMQEAFNKLEPEYNKLCNIALGNPVPMATLIADNKEDKPMKFSLNQILYGPPGTGKTYKTIHNALQIINLEKLFGEWFYENSNAVEKEKAYKTYNKELKELSEEFKTDIFQEYNVSKFLKLKDTILHSDYFNSEKEHADTSSGTSYCETALNWYEKFLKHFSKTDKIRFVTFHQSYSYEEFVEGIKPKTKEGGMEFELKNGIFKEMCIKANSNPRHKYVLVIDEINRGNISKIFGELITLIEDNKRIIPNGKTKEVNGRKKLEIDDNSKDDESLTVILPYSQEEFGVPNNLYIIGTMNTADKSLALLDVALRRRFEFIGKYPQYEILENGKNLVRFSDVLKKINENILSKKDNKLDYLIGHAYFMNKESSLENILQKKIIPLLMEYFNGNFQEIEEILNGIEFKAENGEIKCLTVEQPKDSYKWTIKHNPVQEQTKTFSNGDTEQNEQPSEQKQG